MRLLALLIISLAISVSLSQVVTRGGKYSASYTASDPFRDDRDNLRVKTIRINFASEFSSTPKVAVALYSFSLNYGDAGVYVEVDDVETDYFTFKIYAPEGAAVNSVGVSWIATNSVRVNFRYHTVEYPDAQDQGSGTYLYSNDINFPSLSGSINALPFIAGFQFQTSSDPRLHVEVNSLSSNNVGFDVWLNEDNLPNFIKILVIHFRTDYADDFEIASSYQGTLYAGSGERHQYINRYVDRDSYFGFNAIAGIHFVGQRGYRVRHLTSFSNYGTDQTRIRFDLSTWQTTKVIQTHANMLYRPN